MEEVLKQSTLFMSPSTNPLLIQPKLGSKKSSYLPRNFSKNSVKKVPTLQSLKSQKQKEEPGLKSPLVDQLDLKSGDISKPVEEESEGEDPILKLPPEERKIKLREKIMGLNPFNIPAIKKEPGLPRIGVVQPLPGVSYLATSPSYYEMLA